MTGDNLAQRVRIDKVGKAHRTQQNTLLKPFTVSNAMLWKDRWVGPEGTGYLYGTKWRFHGQMDGEGICLPELTIRDIVRTRARIRMKPSASVEVWNSKIGTTKDEWSETWKVRPMYTAPRDLVSGMKVQRRDLWMASAGGCGSKTCRAQGCRGTENQEHMVTCRVIKYGYWNVEESGETGSKARAGHGARAGGTTGQTVDSYAWKGREDNWQGVSRSSFYGVEIDIRSGGTSAKKGQKLRLNVRSAGQDDAVQNDGSRSKVKKMVQWAAQVAGPGGKLRPTQTQKVQADQQGGGQQLRVQASR